MQFPGAEVYTLPLTVGRGKRQKVHSPEMFGLKVVHPMVRANHRACVDAEGLG